MPAAFMALQTSYGMSTGQLCHRLGGGAASLLFFEGAFLICLPEANRRRSRRLALAFRFRARTLSDFTSLIRTDICVVDTFKVASDGIVIHWNSGLTRSRQHSTQTCSGFGKDSKRIDLQTEFCTSLPDHILLSA